MVDRTLTFYDEHASLYAASTFMLDLGPEQQRFIASLPPPAGGSRAPHRILDAGCGSGRDALAFAGRGFQVIAFDGSAELARVARARTGLSVEHLRFDAMRFCDEFDGVWACASLLHLPPAELDDAVSHIRQALVAGGAFYSCFKVGVGSRVDANGRYFNDFTPGRLAAYLTERGFQVEAVTLSRNKNDPETEWVNAFSRKTGSPG